MEKQIEEKLTELWELTKNRENNHYAWYCGLPSVDELIRLFPINFSSRNSFQPASGKVDELTYINELFGHVQREDAREALKTKAMAEAKGNYQVYKKAIYDKHFEIFGIEADYEESPSRVRNVVNEMKRESESEFDAKVLAFTLKLIDKENRHGISEVVSSQMVTGPIYDEDDKPTLYYIHD